ncbi:PCMD domain-containing protein [Flexithrix dorotheae]|uniref:PCMD domain-containing protein n=1 Tax=Flexithrix dorotheae TaxID=70993 RepID=UPI000365136C|nr:PCMD domain-containing protein [Flexithrix dorotheae]
MTGDNHFSKIISVKLISLILITGSIVLNGCLEEDFFGLSSFGEIKEIEIENQASQAIIKSQSKEIIIEMPGGVDISEVSIQKLTLSSFAKSDKNVGDEINLNDSITFNITAEDGTLTIWKIFSNVASSTPQIPNSDFNVWYKTSGGYYEPGENAETTVWGTGNPGTNILGLLATTPIEISDGNLAANMITLDNGKLSGSFGAPISAGSIYTGKFNPDKIDLSNPAAAIEFGTPFSGRPNSFKLKYTYQPGPENKDKNGNLLNFDDQCDIYALLEVRKSNEVQRLATAWFRSDEIIENPEDLEVQFIYGELDNSFPEFMKPPNGKYVTGDSVGFILPTHITFVASSSFNGNNFAGAIDSQLIIDELELNYN